MYAHALLSPSSSQDIVKELSGIASLNGAPNPAPEHRTAGGVSFTAGDVSIITGTTAAGAIVVTTIAHSSNRLTILARKERPLTL